MAITSMLVMYTLNQSVSSKLPATAYVKLIDVWLLFGLLLPFVILILLILMEHLPDDSLSPMKISPASSMKAPKFSSDLVPTKRTVFNIALSKKAVTSFARFTLPVLEI